MVQTYFAETVIEGKNYEINHYRMRRIRDKFLLTTDHGSWAVLEQKEFSQLVRHELDDTAFKLLEEKGIILTKNNIELVISDYRKRYHFLDQGASLHILLPTIRCNQKCLYCHSSVVSANKKEYDMDFETAEHVLHFIFQAPSPAIMIEFQGGDTLLNTETFKYVVKRAKEINKDYNKKLSFSVVTNLTLMTDELCQWISTEGIDLCTSLDGPAEVHDKNRIMEGGGPSYALVSHWLSRCKELHNVPVGALMVTTKQSFPYWKEIIDEYVKHGLSTVQLKYINKLGYAQNTWNVIGYEFEEFEEYWKKSVEYMIKLNKKGVRIKERYATLILQKILNKHDPSFTDFRSPCGIVIGQIAYNYNGDIYSCDEGRNYDIFRMGNVRTTTYHEVIRSQQAKQLVANSLNDNLLCDNCAYKPYCGTCQVATYAEEGNIIPKLPSNAHHLYFEMMFDYVFDKMIFDAETRDVFFDWVTDWKREI